VCVERPCAKFLPFLLAQTCFRRSLCILNFVYKIDIFASVTEDRGPLGRRAPSLIRCLNFARLYASMEAVYPCVSTEQHGVIPEEGNSRLFLLASNGIYTRNKHFMYLGRFMQ
jgi:hypothetical protein